MNCSIARNSEKLLYVNKVLFLSLIKGPSSYSCIQKLSYVNVYMKWKKDPSYDSIDTIYRSLELKSLISLKNCIAQAPSCCIPISDVSKRGKEFDISMKVAKFMRLYPSVFEEFVGPQYNLPWFRLTPKAIEIDLEEKLLYKDYRSDLLLRLKKLILMSKGKRLPLRIIKGVQWYLGLPDDFLYDPESYLDGSFRFVEMEDGDKALAVDIEEKMMSVLQKNAMHSGFSSGGWMEPIPFPLFPSRGLRLKKKISAWLDEFQKVPYVSPYEDFSHINPESDIAEKRVVGVLHELLSLFVDHAAQRKKLLCLKKYLGFPQKFHKAFERHPYIFYLSLKARTCTVILKEAYEDEASIEMHPLSTVRKKYIELMKDSDKILRLRRLKNRCVHGQNTDSASDSDSHLCSVSQDEYEVETEVKLFSLSFLVCIMALMVPFWKVYIC